MIGLGTCPLKQKNLLFIAKARVLFKNTSVSKVSIDRAGIVLVLGGVEPYPSLDKLFLAFGKFSVAENMNHVFGKTKTGELSVSFSVDGIVPSMSLLLKCARLFLDKNNK